jgi:hypothetical protein
MAKVGMYTFIASDHMVGNNRSRNVHFLSITVLSSCLIIRHRHSVQQSLLEKHSLKPIIPCAQFHIIDVEKTVIACAENQNTVRVKRQVCSTSPAPICSQRANQRE